MVSRRITNVKTRLIDFMNLKLTQGIDPRGTLSVSYHDKPPQYDDNQADFKTLAEFQKYLTNFTEKPLLDFIEFGK